MTRRRTILRHGAGLATIGIGAVGSINPDEQVKKTAASSSVDQCNLPPEHVEIEPAGNDGDGAKELPDDVGDTLGYYFPVGMDPADVPVEQLTDICFHALGIDEDGLPVVHHENEMDAIATLARDAGTIPHLQVGGMEVDFQPAVANPDAFAASAVKVMETYGYRGLAIDWEYPEKGSDFARLMTAVRDALDDRGDFHLGTAVSAVPSIADGVYAMDEVGPLCEYVLIMSYDFSGPWSDRTGHNAPLHSTPTEPLSFDTAIEYWRGGPVEDDRLLAGVPFYGYSFSPVKEGNSGYGQSFAQGAGHTYDEIEAMLTADHFESFVDEAAGVHYAYSAAEQTFLTYESPSTAATKAEHARHVVRGVGVWAVNQDAGGEMTDAVSDRWI